MTGSNDLQKKEIAGLTVVIDRLLCVGFGDCVTAAPEGIVLDEDGIAIFTPGAEAMTREQVLAACRSCPVDAITVLENGVQIAP